MPRNNSKPQKRTSKNEMLRFLGAHLIMGVITAAIFLFGVLYLDIGNLRTLIAKNDAQFIVYPLLFVFFSITFGSAAMGIGIMGHREAKDDENNGPKNGIFANIGKLRFAKVMANKR